MPVKDHDIRRQFARDAIQALQELERNVPIHADILLVYDKLLFDFPIVGAAEVSALADLFQQCLELKSGGGLGPLSKYLVTAKFVENIVGGAKRHPAPAAAPSSGISTNASIFQLTQGAQLAHGSMRAADPGGHTSAAAVGAGATAVQAAYQRLCTCVLLRVAAAALRMPEWEAWQLLRAYEVEEGGDGEVELLDGAAAQGAGNCGGVGGGTQDAGCDGRLACAGELVLQLHGGQHSGGLRGHAYGGDSAAADGVEAAEPDPDDFEFEPLEAPCSSSPAHANLPQGGRPLAAIPPCSAAATAAPRSPCALPSPAAAAADTQQGVWEQVLRKLRGLVCVEHLEALLPVAGTSEAAVPCAGPGRAHATSSSHVKACLAAADSALPVGQGGACGADQGQRDSWDPWRLSDTGGALMQLLRSIGVHTRASDLQPLLQACVVLLGRRLAAHPEEMAAGLQELWDTLGLCGVASMPPYIRGYSQIGKSKAQARLVLAPEASTALTLLVDLSSCHISAQGRAALWRHINVHTLPVLRRCADDVVAAREVCPSTLAAITLVAKVVLFYLEAAPGGFSASKALLAAGVVRGLAAAMPRFAPVPDASDLRAAVLLCAAGNAEVCSWVAAVPGVSAALSAPAFQLGGWGEAQGALWQLLTAATPGPPPAAGNSTQPPAAARPASVVGAGQQAVPGAVPPGAAGQQLEGGRQLLTTLLELGVGCHSLPQLARMHTALELLLKAWQQAGRRCMWGPVVDADLRRALAALKASSASADRPPRAVGEANVACTQLQHAGQDGQQVQQQQQQQQQRIQGQPNIGSAGATRDQGLSGGKLLCSQEHQCGRTVEHADGALGGAPVANGGAAYQACGEAAQECMACGGMGAEEGGAQDSNEIVAELGANKSEGESKARGVDARALEAKSIQGLAGACVKVLKELLMSESKMD